MLKRVLVTLAGITSAISMSASAPQAPAVNRGALRVNRDGHSRRRGRGVADVDVDAEATLAGVEMRFDEQDAGPLQ